MTLAASAWGDKPLGWLATDEPLAPTGAIWPTPAQVLLGVLYGPTGTEYVGTLTAGSGASAPDIAAAVLALLQANTIPVDVVQINHVALTGAGELGNEWGPA